MPCAVAGRRFPGYYGRNWDALVGCLDDLCGAVTGDVGIVGVIREADPLLEASHFPLRDCRVRCRCPGSR
ncbi:barstar family protein [Streptomyces sp. NPDC003717]|uniref:barstar family protein n=1 Tax=Streptomyces sp. NPDC003717 TaxID=3154276 RepID=UPI0033A44629